MRIIMNDAQSRVHDKRIRHDVLLCIMFHAFCIFVLTGCSKDSNPVEPGEGTPYATSVIAADIGCLPGSGLEGCDANQYTNPVEALGPPNFKGWGDDTACFGARYSGFVSLGPNGYIILKMGVDVVDGPGSDIAIYQAVSSERTAVYVAENLSSPFIPIGSQPCVYPCYFDLNGFVNPNSKFRYIMVQDDSPYECYETAGADIDAVEALNYR